MTRIRLTATNRNRYQNAVLLWSDTAIFGGPAVFSTNRKHTARTMYDQTNFRLLALYPFLR